MPARKLLELFPILASVWLPPAFVNPEIKCPKPEIEACFVFVGWSAVNALLCTSLMEFPCGTVSNFGSTDM